MFFYILLSQLFINIRKIKNTSYYIRDSDSNYLLTFQNSLSMGNSVFLQNPITEKKTIFRENNQYRVNVCEMQGWRKYMEDSFIAYLQIPDFQGLSLFGVFDGHGGAQSAKFVAMHFLDCFVKRQTLKEGNIGEALKQTFIHLELMMKAKPAIEQLIQYKKQTTKMNNVTQQDLQSGCTAIVVAITKDKIFCANAGDSRAALCRKSDAQALSIDHKPQNLIEKERIEKAGCQIIGGRVNGLNLTRSIGDFSHKNTPGLPFHKQPITCMPDIKQTQRSNDDQFLLIGCDGVWQKSSEDFSLLTQQIREQMKKKQKQNVSQGKRGLEVLCQFFDRNINPNNMEPFGRDNMTAIMIEFKN